MRMATLATCTLNQWAMDFTGNFTRILESIKQAKKKCASYRTGPELEITGYNCGDHFYDNDTFLHSWEVLVELLMHEDCQDIIIDVGMPIMHKNIAYNCRVIFLNKKIILIRPKKKLCDNGIYRETRWFTGWSKHQVVEDYYLPTIVQDICNQRTTLIGDAVISTLDTSIGFEICEELWNPISSHISHFYDGVEITVNSSGGFHEIGKTTTVLEVIQTATAKCGGIYLFSNLRGCDGDRMYFHGTSHITCNGHILALGKQFSLQDVEVIVATVDLDDVNAYRNHIRKLQTSEKSHHEINIDFSITTEKSVINLTRDSKPKTYSEGEEISLGPACWLWDYLRRSGLNGFLLPLDAGIDSASSAVIVYSLCNLVFESINEGDLNVLSDLRKIIYDPNFVPKNPKQLCNILMVTCHMDTEKSKSLSPNNLALDINSCHINIPICSIIDSFIFIIAFVTGIKLEKPDCYSKEYASLLSLHQYVKITIAHLIAKLFLLSKGKSGNLLILGSGNADKFMIGDFVKYGCSNGDINLTGGITELELESFLKYSMINFQLPSLRFIINLHVDQTSEEKGLEEMSAEHNKRTLAESSKEISAKHNTGRLTETSKEMSADHKIKISIKYKVIRKISNLRKNGCGPFSVFCQFVEKPLVNENIKDIAFQVKTFFRFYSKHHHKIYTISPCFHVGSYASTNIYYDQRQILYNPNWSWQFHAIDNLIQNLEYQN